MSLYLTHSLNHSFFNSADILRYLLWYTKPDIESRVTTLNKIVEFLAQGDELYLCVHNVGHVHVPSYSLTV